MLMLQRAAENVNPSECNDPAVLLACSLGSDSCPAACQKNADEKTSEEEPTASNISDMPIAGDLTIAVADYSSNIKSAPAVGTVVFNAVDFKSSEKVTIESVKLERTGLSDKSNIKGVWFEKDGIAVSAKASLSSDGTVSTRFYNNYSVNGTDTLDLVVQLSGSAGAEIAFNFIGATTTAKNVSLNTVTTTYRTTEYKVATAKFEISWGRSTDTVEYKVGDTTSYEIGKFQITNSRPQGVSEDRDIIVKSIKLKNDWEIDLADTFKNVYVTRDGKTVSKKVELDWRVMTIQFDEDKLASGKKGIYTIFAEVNQLNDVNKTVQLYLNKYSELVADEITSNFRVAYADNDDLKLKSYLFKWGKVTFTNDSSLSKTVNGAASATDVVIGKWTLTLAEPIRLGKITIPVTSASSSKTSPKWAADIIKDLKIEIGGSTYNLYPDNAALPTKYVTDDDEIFVSKTSDIRVLVNVHDEANDWDSVQLAVLNWSNSITKAYYDNSDKLFTGSEVAGSITMSKLTVKAGKFNITNKHSTTQKVVVNSSDEVTIFDGEITSKNDTVSVNNLTLTWEFTRGSAPTNKLRDGEQIDLTVYVDGEPFRTMTIRSSDSSYVKDFANLWDVKADSAMKIKITAQANMSATWDFIFSVGAKWTDSNGNPTTATPVNSSKLQVTAGAELSTSSSTSSNSVIRDGSNAELISFTTTVKNGSYDLEEVKAELVQQADVLANQSLTLEIDGSAVDSTGYVSGTGIVFKWLNETLTVGKHTIAITANVNATNSNATVSFKSVELINGWTTNWQFKSTIKKLIAKAYPTISASTSSNDLILKITNPSDSDETLTIKGFKIAGAIETASLNDSVIDLAAVAASTASGATYSGDAQGAIKAFNDAIAKLNVSLAAGESTELRLQAAKAWTVQVSAITVDAGAQKNLEITSDYTNIGKWTSFKVTANGDQQATNPALKF